jgi:hypothetical protein
MRRVTPSWSSLLAVMVAGLLLLSACGTPAPTAVPTAEPTAEPTAAPTTRRILSCPGTGVWHARRIWV